MLLWALTFAVFGWIFGRSSSFIAHLDVMTIDALLFGFLDSGVGFLLAKLSNNEDKE